MPDPIAKVQALVGCPHVWRKMTLTDDGLWRYWCDRCDKQAQAKNKTDGGKWLIPTPAPDCSTTDGALQAASRLLFDTPHRISVDTLRFAYLYERGDMIVEIALGDECTEHDAATAINELILHALQEREK